MAISLDQVNKKSKNNNSSPTKKKQSSRGSPLKNQRLNLSEKMLNEYILNESLEHQVDLEVRHFTDSPSSTRWLDDLQKKSYLLSRLTHLANWAAKIKLRPKLVIPLPDFLVRFDTDSF